MQNLRTQPFPVLPQFCQLKRKNKSCTEKWLLAQFKQTAEWRATQLAESIPKYETLQSQLDLFFSWLVESKTKLCRGVSKAGLQTTSLIILSCIMSKSFKSLGSNFPEMFVNRQQYSETTYSWEWKQLLFMPMLSRSLFKQRKLMLKV